MRRLTFLVFLTCFFTFRPYQLQNPGLLYGGDDPSYFAYSTALVYGQYPNFDKELVEEFKVPPLSRIGPGLMAAPFVAAFSVIDRITKNPIIERRTRDTVRDSWSLYGALFSAAFYFYLSCALLFISARRYFSSQLSLLSVALMTVSQGVGLYAFVRPVFSHIYELFLQSAFLYLLILRSQKPDMKRSTLWILGLATLSSLMLMVRQNSVIYALLWPALILSISPQGLSFARWRQVLTTLTIAYLSFWVLKYFPFWMAPEKYIEANASFETSSFLFQFQSPYFYAKRLWTVLFGMDWGLIWTAPFLILGCAGLLLKRLPLRKEHLVLALPLLVNLYILVIWKGQGGWYGYRYILFAAIPVLLLPLTALLKTARERSRYFYIACMAWAAFPFLSMSIFDLAPKTVINSVVTEFGEHNAGNLTYQIEVWKQFVGHPFQSIYYLFKTGPSFIAYVLVHTFGFLSSFQDKFRNAYPTFEIRVIVQTFILYALPWALLPLGKKLDQSRD